MYIATSANAQAVKITAGNIVPFEGIGTTPRNRNAEAARHVTLYGTAFLGDPGEVEGLAAGQQHRFHYAAIHLMFSAAALPLPSAKLAVAGNLQHLNAHVTVVPQDSNGNPIADLSALEVLAILPDSVLAVARTDTTHAADAAFAAVTRNLLPQLQAGVALGRRVGPMMASFSQIFHRASAKTQVAYISEHREFGWMWYEHGQTHIEGTHRATAMLEISSAVRFVAVRIRMIGDWKSHGAWQRDLEVVLDLGAGAAPTPAQNRPPF